MVYNKFYHSENLHLKGLFGLRGEGGGEKESRVELAKNRLILGQIYFTPPSASIQT